LLRRSEVSFRNSWLRRLKYETWIRIFLGKTHLLFDNLAAQIIFLNIARKSEIIENVHALMRLNLFWSKDEE
jgi:hypothetical protein